MSWNVRWTRKALKELRSIPAQEQRKLIGGIARFAETGHGDIRKLDGSEDEYRLKIDKWRAIFFFDRPQHAIVITRVFDRKEGYE